MGRGFDLPYAVIWFLVLIFFYFNGWIFPFINFFYTILNKDNCSIRKFIFIVFFILLKFWIRTYFHCFLKFFLCSQIIESAPILRLQIFTWVIVLYEIKRWTTSVNFTYQNKIWLKLISRNYLYMLIILRSYLKSLLLSFYMSFNVFYANQKDMIFFLFIRYKKCISFFFLFFSGFVCAQHCQLFFIVNRMLAFQFLPTNRK